MTVLTFQAAIEESARYSKRHLLLGNGFSIALRPNIFAYGKLYEQADFSKLSPTAKTAFVALGTQDFERVIKALRDAKKILAAYGGASQAVLDTLQSDADGLRELLVQTIAASHPAWPGEISDAEYDGDEPHLVSRHHGTVRQRQGDVGLAHAARAEQHHVFRSFDECQMRQLLDLRLRRSAADRPVELLERLHRRHGGQLHQRRSLALLARGGLALQQLLHEVGEARLVSRGLLRQRGPFRGHAGHFQLLAQAGDALVLQVHAATPSSSS